MKLKIVKKNFKNKERRFGTDERPEIEKLNKRK